MNAMLLCSFQLCLAHASDAPTNGSSIFSADFSRPLDLVFEADLLDKEGVSAGSCFFSKSCSGPALVIFFDHPLNES
jgi:hypothetical protein